MKNITKAITLLGSIVLIVSIVQWFFRFPDISQLLFGAGLGCVILIFAYIHNWMTMKDKETNNDERRITELEFWARQQGFEK